MYSQHEAEKRRNEAERDHRLYGLYEHQNATEAQYDLSNVVIAMRTALPGAPLVLQDSTGTITYLPGLMGPLQNS